MQATGSWWEPSYVVDVTQRLEEVGYALGLIMHGQRVLRLSIPCDLRELLQSFDLGSASPDAINEYVLSHSYTVSQMFQLTAEEQGRLTAPRSMQHPFLYQIGGWETVARWNFFKTEAKAKAIGFVRVDLRENPKGWYLDSTLECRIKLEWHWIRWRGIWVWIAKVALVVLFLLLMMCMYVYWPIWWTALSSLLASQLTKDWAWNTVLSGFVFFLKELWKTTEQRFR